MAAGTIYRNYKCMRIKLILFYLLLTKNLFAQETHVKVFPFKSAIIEYEYEAALGGTHIKYIDDYGYKQADYIKKEIHIGDKTEKQFEIRILIGKFYNAIQITMLWLLPTLKVKYFGSSKLAD